jgi:hypothetical protein
MGFGFPREERDALVASEPVANGSGLLLVSGLVAAGPRLAGGACLVVGWVDGAAWLRVIRLRWLAEGRGGADVREAHADDHVRPNGRR